MCLKLPACVVLAMLGWSSIASVCAAADGVTPGGLEGGVTLATDFVWRGVSQTDGNPGIIGEIKWTHSSNVFVGIWAANLDFGADADTHSEFDYFVGYSKTSGRLNVHTGYLYCVRESDRADLSNSEITGSIAYDFGPASVRAGLYYSWDYFLGGRSLYHFVSTRVALGKLSAVPLAFSANIGQFDFTQADIGDYVDWRLRLIADVYDLEIEIGYTNTDIDPVTSRVLGRAESDGRVAIGVTKMF